MGKIIYDVEEMEVVISNELIIDSYDFSNILSGIVDYISENIANVENKFDFIEHKYDILNIIVETYDCDLKDASEILNYILNDREELTNLITDLDTTMNGNIVDVEKVVENILLYDHIDLEDVIIFDDSNDYIRN